MKSLKNILGSTVMVALALTATSCTEGNDWDVDGSLSRLFGIDNNKLSIETTETTATVTFTALSSKDVTAPDYYVFEVSKDSLYEGVENANIIRYGDDKNLTTSPVELTGLDSDSKYYLRVKSMSANMTESKWVYYKDGESFKTKAEQLFNEVPSSDLFDDHVILTWTPGAEVTHITMVNTANPEEKSKHELTDAEKAAGRIVRKELTGNTTYVFTLYNGDVKRGQLTITTPAPMPAADYKVTLDADITEINQDLIEEISEAAKAAAGGDNYSATIGIRADKNVTFSATSIPDGMSVNFFGLAGGEAPTFNVKKALEIGGSHSFITFQNLKIMDGGAGYIINQKNACTVGTISMEDCSIDNIKTSVFRMQGSDAKTVSNLIIKNCVFTKCGAGYAFIHADASKKGKFDNINIENCTFNTVCATGKHFIYSKDTPSTSIAISNCTFYNVNGGGQFFIDFNKDTIGPKTLSITNCIFAKQPDEAINKNIRCSATPEISGCYATKDWFKAFPNLTMLDYTSDALFTDAANGDFSFKAGTLNEKVGDPRWFATEE